MAQPNRNGDLTADWADMRIFLAVLDKGNLGAAAEALNLSQPTVGRRLSALEGRLGSSLFARTGRRMVPTDVARSIEDAARRMAHEMHAIERTVTGAAEGLNGLVTISASEGTGSEWLIPKLAEFREIYPDILIRLVIESRTADLVGREADIALRLGRPTQLDLIIRHLATLGFGFYASPEYLQQRPPIKSIADLVGVDWVVTQFENQLQPFLQEFFDEHIGEAKIVLMTTSLTAQVKAVKSGLGVGMLSHRWATMTGGVERVLPDLEKGDLELWLVSHEDLRHSARIRAVADFIAEAAQRDAELFRHGGEPE